MSHPLSEAHTRWLENRGLDVEWLQERFFIFSAIRDPASHGDDSDEWYEPIPNPKGSILVWPYIDGGVEVNAKFRAPKKVFFQRRGAPKTFCNADVLDDPEVIAGKQAVVITEGEPDMATAISAGGHPWSMSVPDGAPADVDQFGRPIPMKPDKEINPEDDAKFAYIVNNLTRLDRVKRFILATDDDGPGRRLRDELARRLGRVRCSTVTYPRDPRVPVEEGFGKRAPKDLNEVLQHFGAEAVQEVLRNAKPYPVMGLYTLDDYQEQDELQTYPIGMPDLKDYLRLYRGGLMVVSGIPEHGKSLWVDQVCFNMAVNYGWRTAFATFEEGVQPNLRNKFTDFYTMKLRANWTLRDRAEADDFIRRYFAFISEDPHGADNEEPPTLDWVLDRAADAVIRFGIDCLVIDPWNEIFHKRLPGEMRDEYLQRALQKVKRFAKQYGVMVIVVVHPTKEAGQRALRDNEPMSVYDITDGAMWYNKAEHLVLIARGQPPNEVGRGDSLIMVRKCKFHREGAGKRGDVRVIFDARLNMYNDGPVETVAPTLDLPPPQKGST